MQESVVYEHLQGNVRDILAADMQPLRVERTGCFLCLNGSADIVLDQMSYRLESGSLCIYFPYTVLEVKRRSDDLDGLVMAVDLESVSPLLSRITNLDGLLEVRHHPVVNLKPQMMRVIHGYMTLYRHHQDLAQTYATSGQRRLWQLNNLQLERAKECLMLQIIIAFTGEDALTKNSLSRKDEIVSQFLQTLRIHYRQEHEVGFYADKQCLSMRYFSYVVRTRTSQTPSQWIAGILLTDAKQMLVETGKSVKEIAELLNFPTQSYFGKWFKAHTGMGPVEYKHYVDKAK